MMSVVNDCALGGMLVVLAPLAHFEQYPDVYQGVELGCANSANNFCVTGHRVALEHVQASLSKASIGAVDLPVLYPFHSSYIESIKDKVMTLANGVAIQSPHIPYYSSTYGRLIKESD
ncbi:hypothetical protein [Mycoavidus sp. B2-EB]|uniref:hypothetical protein n=1 Tax=Mycoavidus sp. B2-EB TaxID=2651972 RepID=UPI001627A312|nr:hypothetical protein [Mycoavidus sp. B2-EB]BBO59620.1 polyketide synthase [Mycoavidus sp. B2-EB]